MTCLETFATLRVFSETMTPDSISRVLGVESTKSEPRDEHSKYRTRREQNYWACCTKDLLNSADGVAHLGKLTTLFAGKGQELDSLRAVGCEIDVCCYWVSSGQGGPLLAIDIMQSLVELKLEIWWDVYFGEDDDYQTEQIPSTEGDA